MNLNKLRDKAYQCAVAHGWHEENLSDELHIPKHTRSLSGSLLGYKTIP